LRLCTHNPCLFFDAFVGCFHAPEIRGQVLVIGHMIKEVLPGHVIVFEAGNGEGRGQAVEDVVVVILFGVDLMSLK